VGLATVRRISVANPVELGKHLIEFGVAQIGGSFQRSTPGYVVLACGGVGLSLRGVIVHYPRVTFFRRDTNERLSPGCGERLWDMSG
jgi:hypothetical protein